MVCCHLVSEELFIGLPVCCSREMRLFVWRWSFDCFGWAGAPPWDSGLLELFFVAGLGCV